ncbi:MAG TPA: DUF222 domain-containing protein [Longimicrobiales bacterium]|nr:DUF222 domain-containing protein [Longimicrobiales bacterium]
MAEYRVFDVGGGWSLGAEPVDPDVAEALEEEIVSLAAHIGAATHRLLVLLARFERLRSWELAGHRTCAHWLSFATGYDLGTASEHVRVARALESLPLIGAAMAKGELSFSQVRALTRVAEPASEPELLELARGCPTAYLEREVRAWRNGTRQDEAARERERHESRTFAIFPDDDGMYVVRGRVTPEVGAVLMRAVEAAGDALFRAKPEPGEDTEREAARRRADAVGLLAERALGAGFGGSRREGEDAVEGGGRAGSEDDVEGWVRTGSEAPVSGTQAERYVAFLHVDASTLSEEGEPGRSHLEDGTRVSAESARRLTCDCAVVRVTHGADGSVLDVGRKTRSIPPALRRALEVRDRGCRFPGCNARFTAAHHVIHWADQGPTSLANCMLLCRHHHRLVHEGRWSVEWWGEGRPAFRDPRGQVHFDGGWRPPKLGDRPVDDLVRDNRKRGIRPDPCRRGLRWKREADIPTGVLLRAMEAVG